MVTKRRKKPRGLCLTIEACAGVQQTLASRFNEKGSLLQLAVSPFVQGPKDSKITPVVFAENAKLPSRQVQRVAWSEGRVRLGTDSCRDLPTRTVAPEETIDATPGLVR